MRHALIENGEVTSVILWDGEGDMFDGMLVIELADDSPVGPGWTHDGAKFAPPANPVEPTT